MTHSFLSISLAKARRDQMKLQQFFQTMEYLRKELGGEYAPQQLSILLLVSMRPGITHNELSAALNMPQGTVSRNVTKLCSRKHPKTGREIGYGLVENRMDELYDSRRNAVHLTVKGKQFIAKIKSAIGGD
jgi:DNA-binding MarR family transcriptional regulator